MANMLNPLNWFADSTSNPQNNQAQTQEQLMTAIRKASVMDRVGDTRSKETDKLAVSTIPAPWHEDQKDGGIMAAWTNSGFRDYLRFNMNQDKLTRINDFRLLAKEEKIEACLHEIAISCLASHDKESAIKAELVGDYDEDIRDIINKELEYVVNFFKFDERGQDYFKEFLITGELVFENVYSVLKPELGILDVKAIPPENIDPIYRNQYNNEIEAFVLRKPNNSAVNKYTQQVNRQQQSALTFDTIPMACSQVTYCNSGEWDQTLYMVIPYIVKGQDAQKKLSLIEDSIVINAMVNAPERLLWNIPVGKMDQASQGRYMRNIINGHKRKKGTDGKGNVMDKYDPISITEDFYIPVQSDGQSAKVERLAGSAAFSGGFGGMLDYFHQKVFEDMHVPITRLNPDAAQSDGQTITMQELAFAERIIALQKIVAAAVKKTLITHLKLKGLKLHNESCEKNILLEGRKENRVVDVAKISDEQRLTAHLNLVDLNYYSETLKEKCLIAGGDENIKLLHELGLSYWDQYEIEECDIEVRFSLPTSFMALRDQQQFDLKWNNFNSMASSGFFSVFLLAKEELGWTDEKILKHIEWKRKEAEKNWELAQIEEGGPEFRANAAADAGIGGGALGGVGSEVPDLGGEDAGAAPEFGDDAGLDDLGTDEPIDDAGGAEEAPEEPVGDVGEEPEGTA